MEWCYVWWPSLSSKRVARVCQHQLSFVFNLGISRHISKLGRITCLKDLWALLVRGGRITQSTGSVNAPNKLTTVQWCLGGKPAIQSSVLSEVCKFSTSWDILEKKKHYYETWPSELMCVLRVFARWRTCLPRQPTSKAKDFFSFTEQPMVSFHTIQTVLL